MCRMPFRIDALILVVCYKSRAALSFAVVNFHPSKRAQAHSQPGCSMFCLAQAKMRKWAKSSKKVKPIKNKWIDSLVPHGL